MNNLCCANLFAIQLPIYGWSKTVKPKIKKEIKFTEQFMIGSYGYGSYAIDRLMLLNLSIQYYGMLYAQVIITKYSYSYTTHLIVYVLDRIVGCKST